MPYFDVTLHKPGSTAITINVYGDQRYHLDPKQDAEERARTVLSVYDENADGYQITRITVASMRPFPKRK